MSLTKPAAWRKIPELSQRGHGECIMEPEAIYDIFRKTSDKDATWVESVTGLEQAKKRMLKLASTTPGAYLLYDPRISEFIEPFANSAS
jgi:hypothetical protein